MVNNKRSEQSTHGHDEMSYVKSKYKTEFTNFLTVLII